MKKRQLRWMFFVFLLSVPFSCSVGPHDHDKSSYLCTEGFDTSEQVHAKKEILDQTLLNYQKQGLPGVAMLVHNNDTFWIGSAGYADIAAKAPFETCSLTRIGSVGKTYLSALTLKLVEAEKLSLSDKAADYLDESLVEKISNLDMATVEQLLNNTSGIVNYSETLGWGLDSIGNLDNPNYVSSYDNFLEFIYYKDAYFPVGAGFHYSNSNFLLVGMVLESATGKSMKSLFQEYVFTPVSLNNTFYDSNVHYRSGQVQGYLDLYGDGKLRNNTESRFGGDLSDGGLATNVYDMYIFVRAIVDVDIGFLSQNSIDAMQNWTDISYSEDANGYYGLGFSITTTEFGDRYGHSGGMMQGYRTELRYHPAHDTTILIFTNSFFGKTDDILNGLMYRVQEILFTDSETES